MPGRKAMPRVMDAGGSRGKRTADVTLFLVISRFMILMPSPSSTMEIAALFSSVV